MAQDLFFHQLLAGRDFATEDRFAATMRNHTYVVGDPLSRDVVLVDPAYDVRGLLRWLEAAGARLVGVFASHYHADHVGGEIFGERIEGIADLLQLADVPVHVQKLEMPWVQEMTTVPASSLVAHGDGDVVEVGSVRIQLLHTPGHTQGSQCLVVDGNLITGDTLFIEGCGRTDLPGADPVDMYATLLRLASLPGHLRLWPGHHYSAERSALLREVRSHNPVLRRMAKEEWLQKFGAS